MKVSLNPVATAQLLHTFLKKMERTDRKPGVHVSDLVTCLRKAKARGLGLMPPTNIDDVMIFATGEAIQDWIVGKVDTEVEVEAQGIHGTMDYYGEAGVPTEVKATYYSDVVGVDEKAPHYLDQLASYCVLLAEQTGEPVTLGQLIVYYINGPYNLSRSEAKKVRDSRGRPVRSTMKVHDVEFTVGELLEWGSELLRRANELRLAADIYDIPIEYHYTWECGTCPLLDAGLCMGGEGTNGDTHRRIFREHS